MKGGGVLTSSSSLAGISLYENKKMRDSSVLFNLLNDNKTIGENMNQFMGRFNEKIKSKRYALKQHQIFVMTVGQPMLKEILFGDNGNLKTKIMDLKINALKELIDNVVYLSNDVITQRNNVELF